MRRARAYEGVAVMNQEEFLAGREVACKPKRKLRIPRGPGSASRGEAEVKPPGIPRGPGARSRGEAKVKPFQGFLGASAADAEVKPR